MTSVYLVTSGSYDDYSLLAAFSDEGKARSYVEYARAHQPWHDLVRIEALPIDRWQMWEHQHYWHVTVTDDVTDKESGAVLRSPATVQGLEPDLRSAEPLPVDQVFHYETTAWYCYDGPLAKTWFSGFVGELADTLYRKHTIHSWEVVVAANTRDEALVAAKDRFAQEKARLAGQ